MNNPINSKYPDIDFLRKKAKKRVPRFAFEYLDGGCNAEINLWRNTKEIRDIQLNPVYLKKFDKVDLKTELFGQTYHAPFGISPIGLQGLIWPEASEILARTAFEHKIPFILSTVGTASIEKIGEITEGNAWFQLYHPTEDSLRDDILLRMKNAGYQVLVILCDVPSFGYRPKEIRNGLAIPPKLTIQNLIQIFSRPQWAIQTLLHGQPEFASLKKYMPSGMNLRHLGLFMNKTFTGRLNEDKIKAIRDKWDGKLVLKGVASETDAKMAIRLGLDGIIVSNHGGRQLDNGPSTIGSLRRIIPSIDGQIKIMMDSGIRTGPDIAVCLAKGAEFTFLGRSFMYGVGALGKNGGNQVVSILKKQLTQVMQQLGCERINELQRHILSDI